MDVEGRFSISPQALYVRLGTQLAPIVVDVRRSPAFEADDTVIAGAIRRSPEEVDHWRRELTEGRSVVVYCAHGQEVAQIRQRRYARPGATPVTSNMALAVGPNFGCRAAASSVPGRTGGSPASGPKETASPVHG